MPSSRQAARDVSGFSSWINAILGGMVANEEDRQILSGGGGAELSGILNDGDIQTQSFSTNIIETVRKAMTKLEVGDPCLGGGFAPTAIVMHPNDWESAELTKDLNERYMLLGTSDTPRDSGPRRLWAIPVVATPAMTQGYALVGAFDVGAALWTYDDLSLRITDSHSDYFIKNLLAILAEMREPDDTALRRCNLIAVDSREAVWAEAGDFLIPGKAGWFTPSHVHAEIGEIAAGRKAGRGAAYEITLFKAVGLAILDVAVADAIVTQAEIKGVGVEIQL